MYFALPNVLRCLSVVILKVLVCKDFNWLYDVSQET